MVSRRSVHLAVLLVTAALTAVAGLTGVGTAQGPRGPADWQPAVEEPAALRVLRAWDARRSAAFAAGDPTALAALYVSGSRTGLADVAVLRGYRARGLRVTRMTSQVLEATVLAQDARRVVLRVTDVLVRAVVADARGRSWRLPSDRPTTRRVVLVRHSGRWLVEEAFAVAATRGSQASAR